jgi:hypothetical protein
MMLTSPLLARSAFPTYFNVIPQQWTWSGTLSTINSNGVSACVTTDSSFVSIDFFSQPASITFPPYMDGVDDPRGWNFWPAENPANFAIDIPDEIAFSACVRQVVSPNIAGYLPPAYRVLSSTSYESGISTRTTRVASPSPTAPAPNCDASKTGTVTVVSEGPAGPETNVVTTCVALSPAGSVRMRLGSLGVVCVVMQTLGVMLAVALL